MSTVTGRPNALPSLTCSAQSVGGDAGRPGPGAAPVSAVGVPGVIS